MAIYIGVEHAMTKPTSDLPWKALHLAKGRGFSLRAHHLSDRGLDSFYHFLNCQRFEFGKFVFVSAQSSLGADFPFAEPPRSIFLKCKVLNEFRKFLEGRVMSPGSLLIMGLMYIASLRILRPGRMPS